jgi:hypothetical protein
LGEFFSLASPPCWKLYKVRFLDLRSCLWWHECLPFILPLSRRIQTLC